MITACSMPASALRSKRGCAAGTPHRRAGRGPSRPRVGLHHRSAAWHLVVQAHRWQESSASGRKQSAGGRGPEGYARLLEPLPAAVQFIAPAFGSHRHRSHLHRPRAELQRSLAAYRKTLKPTAMIWVSWPKKSAKVPTDITEDTVREVALPLGFVDIKVCAVTDVWSGLKLVVRKELR